MRQNFKQEYFDADELKPSKRYLDDMKDMIGLEELRLTVNNYYTNVIHKVCAVLVMIKDDELIKTMGKQFLLQVWSEGKIIFERKLQRPPIQVSVSHTALIGEGYTMVYVTHPEDSDVKSDNANVNQYLYNLVSFDEDTKAVTHQIQIKDHQNILFDLVPEVKKEKGNSGNALVLEESKS